MANTTEAALRERAKHLAEDYMMSLDSFDVFDNMDNQEQAEAAIYFALSQPPAPSPLEGEVDPWSDEVGALVDFGFQKVSRNPSDHETALAYRYAIIAALSTEVGSGEVGK